jgi:hypothetical protein
VLVNIDDRFYLQLDPASAKEFGTQLVTLASAADQSVIQVVRGLVDENKALGMPSVMQPSARTRQ